MGGTTQASCPLHGLAENKDLIQTKGLQQGQTQLCHCTLSPTPMHDCQGKPLLWLGMGWGCQSHRLVQTAECGQRKNHTFKKSSNTTQYCLSLFLLVYNGGSQGLQYRKIHMNSSVFFWIGSGWNICFTGSVLVVITLCLNTIPATEKNQEYALKTKYLAWVPAKKPGEIPPTW